MRVYFDASVIIAAILSPSGGSALLLEYVRQAKIVGVTSQTVIEEVFQEDKQSKIKRSKKELGEFISQSRLIVRKAVTALEIGPYQGLVDVEDAHLIAGANLTKCLYLVTLDKKHLLREDIKKKFLPLQIVPPKELLEEIIYSRSTS